MIKALDHIQLAMPKGEEEKAKAYYIDILDFKEKEKLPHLLRNGGCWFEIGGSIEVHVGVEEDFRPARKAHPAFRVDDLEELAKKLKQKGFDTQFDDKIVGVRRIFSHDPFGNRIEFIQD